MSYHHPLSEPPPPRNRADGRHRQPGHGPGNTPGHTGPTGPADPAWADPMEWGSPAYTPYAPYAAPAGGAPAYDPFATDHRDAFPEPGRQGPPTGHPATPGPRAHGDGPGGHGGDREGIRRLGSAYKLLRRVSTLAALGYFVLYLLLSAYAPDLMTTAVSGGLTVGVLLGLVQLPVALAAIAVYERIARVRVDPRAREVRERAGAAGTAPAAAGRPARRRTAGGARA